MRRYLFVAVIITAIAVANSNGPCCYGAAPAQKLLMTGHFHGDEVQAKSGEIWLGLFRTRNGGYELRNTKIKVDREYDGIVDFGDKEVKTTGKALSVPHGDPIFLVRGLSELKPGRVATAAPTQPYRKSEALDRHLTCGQTITLKFKNQCARLIVSGRPVKDKDGYDWQSFGYKVTLQCTGRSQVIYGSDDCHVYIDGSPSLIWAGDLDGDGRIDLFIDMTNHYNVSAPTLFLSSKAGRGRQVKKVAGFWCCGC